MATLDNDDLVNIRAIIREELPSESILTLIANKVWSTELPLDSVLNLYPTDTLADDYLQIAVSMDGNQAFNTPTVDGVSMNILQGNSGSTALSPNHLWTFDNILTASVGGLIEDAISTNTNLRGVKK